MNNQHVHPIISGVLNAISGTQHQAPKQADTAFDRALSVISEQKKIIESMSLQLAARASQVNAMRRDLDEIAPMTYAIVLDGQTDETPIPQEVLLSSIAELHRQVDVALALEKIVQRQYLQYVFRLREDARIATRGDE